MNERDLAYLQIRQVLALLESGDISSEEVTAAQLARIAALDDRLNAYITVLHDDALASARQADTLRRAGERLPLLGIPIALKDLLATKGILTTGGSPMLADNVPDFDATVTRRLAEAGAVLLGKTNMLEFAYGYPNPEFGETRNPWNLAHTAGGSSGGSVAAVAAGLAYGTIGSDTGGSIRSPAAYCGVVGLKPTYGRVSRHGVLPLSWSLDHVGPLTRSAWDAALMFDAISGYDPLDPASAPGDAPPTLDQLDEPLAGLRIGLVEYFFDRNVQDSVRAVALEGVALLECIGAVIEPVTIEHVELVSPVIWPIVQAEASSYHAVNLREQPEKFGPATRENLRLGSTLLATDYLAAQRIRRLIIDATNAALANVDVLLFPTQPIVAPVLGTYKMANLQSEGILEKEIGHTGFGNITGHPALSVPCGLSDVGLPVALQFTGKPYADGLLLRIAHQFEQAFGPFARPPID